MLEFSSVQKSIGTCFAMLLGDFQWSLLAMEHFMTAAMWFVLFMGLVLLVMLNMILAIVMDVYTEVRAATGAADPMWTQGAKLLRPMISSVKGRFRHRCRTNPDAAA